MKKIFSLLLALALLCCLPLTVYAHDVPQERNDCSIEVVVRYNGENISGGTLTAVKVGYVDEEDGNYFFSQEMTGVRLDDVTSSNAPAVQKEFYDNNRNGYDFYTQTKTVKNGKATFSGLSTGLYLIIQETAADGYSKLNPFLVSVPYMENGEYQYHVKASIKLELEREPEPTDPPPTTPDDPKLPQTGQLNWPVPLLVVSGLVLFTAGWGLRFGRKKKQYEK